MEAIRDTDPHDVVMEEPTEEQTKLDNTNERTWQKIELVIPNVHSSTVFESQTFTFGEKKIIFQLSRENYNSVDSLCGFVYNKVEGGEIIVAAKFTIKSECQIYDCVSVIEFDILNDLNFGTGNSLIIWEKLIELKFKLISNNSIKIFIDLCVLPKTSSSLSLQRINGKNHNEFHLTIKKVSQLKAVESEPITFGKYKFAFLVHQSIAQFIYVRITRIDMQNCITPNINIKVTLDFGDLELTHNSLNSFHHSGSFDIRFKELLWYDFNEHLQATEDSLKIKIYLD